MKKHILVFSFFLCTATNFVAFCQNNPKTKKNVEKQILIETTHGNIKIKLYNETPQHRDNFIKL
ncbi:MAG: peptidylprolyl isomerase, partial [Bacteroidales bacterium]